MGLLHYVWDLVVQSTTKVAFICSFLLIFLSLLPMIITTINNDIELDQSFIDVTLKPDYHTWLLINIIATIPMMFEYCLDLQIYYHDCDKCEFGLYRLATIISIVIPNTIMYLVIQSKNNSSLMVAIKYEISDIQTSLIFSFIMLSMFCTNFTKTCEHDYTVLKKKLGNATMIFFITLLFSRVVFVLKVILFGKYTLFVIFADIIFLGNSSIIYYALFSILYYNITRKVYDVSRFGDFLHSAPFLIQFIGGTYMKIFDSHRSAYLYFQLAVIQVLTIVPSQYNLCQAQVNVDKLKLKLNLLRYVSHEMRTPLNIAILGTKLATESLMGMEKELKIQNGNQFFNGTVISNTLDTLKKVSMLCNFAVSTLDDVLTFDKLDEKKLTLEKEVCNPWLLIHTATEQFAEKARESSITFTIKCLSTNSSCCASIDSSCNVVSDDSWVQNIEFSCDQHKVTRVIQDLILNAFECTPRHGYIAIFLGQLKLNGEGNDCNSMIRINIQCSGENIAIQNQEISGQSYTQVNIFNDHKYSHELGLQWWIDKDIVEMHSGCIHVQSLRAGIGTEMMIDLPFLNRINNTAINDSDCSSFYINEDDSHMIMMDDSIEISPMIVESPQDQYSLIPISSQPVYRFPFNIVSSTFPRYIRLPNFPIQPLPVAATTNNNNNITFSWCRSSLTWPFVFINFSCIHTNGFIFGCVILYCLLSLLLIVVKVTVNIPNDVFFDKVDQNLEFLEFLFQNWFLITIFSVIPMILNWFFDCFHNSVYGSLYIFYRLTLILGIFLPNVLIYFTFCFYKYKSNYIVLQIISTQWFIVRASLLGLIFQCDIPTEINKYLTFKNTIISTNLSIFLILYLTAKMLFIFITLINSHKSLLYILITLSSIFDTCATALVIYVVGRLLLYYLKNWAILKFESHSQLSDFSYGFIFMLYFIGAVLPFYFIVSTNQMIAYSLYYYSLYVLTVLLSVIPSRCYLHLAIINEEKILIRANLISYLSREMKRPINNAIYKACKVSVDLDAMRESLKNMGLLEYNVEIDNIQDILKDVLESCKVSELTLDDLLVLDQLDDKKLTIDMENVNPWELVQSVASPFGAVAKLSNINYTIECHGGNAWDEYIGLHCDRFKISQVIRNLISNALKFTHAEGSVSVIVEIFNSNGDTSGSIDTQVAPTIRIIVSDSGAGISAENQKKMFGQYVQFNAAALQKGKGSGLGLWISKNIVELHGGTLTVFSDGEGCGSVFQVELTGYRYRLDPIQENDDTNTSTFKKMSSMESPSHYKHSNQSNSSSSSSSPSKIGEEMKTIVLPISTKTTTTSNIPYRLSFAKCFDMNVKRFSSNSNSSSSCSLSESLQPLNASLSPRGYNLMSDRIGCSESNQHEDIKDDVADSKFLSAAELYILSTPRIHKRLTTTTSSCCCCCPSHKLEMISSSNNNVNDESTKHSYVTVTPRINKNNYLNLKQDDSAAFASIIQLPITISTSKTTSSSEVDCLYTHAGRSYTNKDPSYLSELITLSSKIATARFLVVDDSISSRKMVSRLLIRSGHQVTEANDGLHCLELLFDTNNTGDIIHYDVILIDDAMPNMNGPEAVLKLRQRGYKGLVIGLTGSTDDKTFNSFMSSGANEVLSKPLDMILLSIYLKSYLS